VSATDLEHLLRWCSKESATSSLELLGKGQNEPGHYLAILVSFEDCEDGACSTRGRLHDEPLFASITCRAPVWIESIHMLVWLTHAGWHSLSESGKRARSQQSVRRVYGSQRHLPLPSRVAFGRCSLVTILVTTLGR
jgi:hypothetical protein